MELKRALLLYRLVSKNQRLQDRRHPMFEKNMAVKVMAYIFIAFWAIYLMFFGVAFYHIFEGGPLESFDMIDGGLIIFLTMDFFIRFGMQETPAQDIKQYRLLPISQNFLLNVFLLRMGMRTYNLFWFFFFVPFGLLAIPQFYGLMGLVGYLIGIWLMFMLNSYWYLYWRTLINKNIFWLAIPIVFYAACIYFGLIDDKYTRMVFGEGNTQPLFYASLWLMRWFAQWKIVAYVIIMALLVPLFYINRLAQAKSVFFEISKAEVIKKVKSNQMKWLDKFGAIGEYLKLEIKSPMRNANIRKVFISGVTCMLIFCSVFAFTDVYDNDFMRIYICTYCFSVLGVMTLTNVMGAEGNYIDGLMSRKESVLSLLKAKYYFNFIMLLVPLLFTIMPVAKGKLTVIDAFGCLFFTSGTVFPFLFQLAAYNDTTLRLNEKITKAGGSTKAQMICSFAALFLPMIVMYTLMTLFSEDVAAWCMFGIGLVGTLLHPIWLRYVYKSFMRRRYKNMDGFRNSRN